jgi:hypothetical protein
MNMSFASLGTCPALYRWPILEAATVVQRAKWVETEMSRLGTTRAVPKAYGTARDFTIEVTQERKGEWRQ